MSGKDDFLNNLRAALQASGKDHLPADAVRALGREAGLDEAATVDQVEWLRAQGVLQLQWGGAVALATKVPEQGEGMQLGGITIQVSNNSNVLINSPAAVAGKGAAAASTGSPKPVKRGVISWVKILVGLAAPIVVMGASIFDQVASIVDLVASLVTILERSDLILSWTTRLWRHVVNVFGPVL